MECCCPIHSLAWTPPFRKTKSRTLAAFLPPKHLPSSARLATWLRLQRFQHLGTLLQTRGVQRDVLAA